MSLWPRTGLALAALLLACTKPNPAFDPDADSASASDSAGPTGDPATTTVVTPTSTSTSTGASTSQGETSTTAPLLTSTGDTRDESTTGPACSLPGEPCGPADCCGCGTCMAGTCVPDNNLCGPCSTCSAGGVCQRQPESTPCKLADDPCADTLFGLEGSDCFASAPADGRCDADGQCQAQACTRGPLFAGCEFACLKDAGACSNGTPTRDFDLASFCAQNEPTVDCKHACVDNIPDDRLEESSCQQGKCQLVKTTSCGNYHCKSPDMCPAMCVGPVDCNPGHLCVMNMCA